MRECFDVVILGCGEAGIFAAYELEKLNPGPASTITQEQIDEVYNGAKAPTMGEGEGELPKAARAEG